MDPLKDFRSKDPMVRDSTLHGEMVPSEEEVAYRRGYHQGYSMALYDVERGCSLKSLSLWAATTLRKWRIVGHPQKKGTFMKTISPPEAPAPPKAT
jgi:hypothetical protein